MLMSAHHASPIILVEILLRILIQKIRYLQSLLGKKGYKIIFTQYVIEHLSDF